MTYGDGNDPSSGDRPYVISKDRAPVLRDAAAEGDVSGWKRSIGDYLIFQDIEESLFSLCLAFI